jgi:hypothetical protein
MEQLYIIPNLTISMSDRISHKFSSLNINSLHEACIWIKDLPYGYNSTSEDSIILFEENKGTCSTKHGVIAELAEELNLPLYKFICFYKLDSGIVEGIDVVLSEYGLEYIPQTHCVLGMNSSFFDLTSGNCHGRKKEIVDMDLFFKVPPNPDKLLKEKIFNSGLEYYRNRDPKFANYNLTKYLEILRKCDEFHHNLCRLKSE